MSKKTYLLVAFLISLLLAGIIYYETTRDKYKVDKIHWIEVMQNISSNDTRQRLSSRFLPEEKSFWGRNYTYLLLYLRSHVLYTKEDFIRSEDPEVIIWSLHLGRCGEFSIAYTALLLAFDFDARLVVAMGFDHMWVEVQSNGQWIHTDPTQGIVNNPFIYKQWEKSDGISRPIDGDHPIFAFQTDGTVVDVTGSYVYAQ